MEAASIDDVSFMALGDHQQLFEADNEFLMYAFVRDIDYDEGLHLITPAGLSEAEIAANLERLNAIVPCNPKLFSLP